MSHSSQTSAGSEFSNPRLPLLLRAIVEHLLRSHETVVTSMLAAMMVLGTFCGIAFFALFFGLMRHHEARGDYLVADRNNELLSLLRHDRVFRFGDLVPECESGENRCFHADLTGPSGDKQVRQTRRASAITKICTKCGVSIQDATAEPNHGLCQPCSEGRMVSKPSIKPANLERKRSIDSMCIVIEKHTESETDATYRYIADVWEPDPETRGRSRIAGQAVGILRLFKSSGEVVIDQPMPGDTNDKQFHRDAWKIVQHRSRNEYPERTMFACG